MTSVNISNTEEIRRANLLKFRTALTNEYARRSIGAPQYSTDLIAGKPQKAKHVQELRDLFKPFKPVIFTDNPIKPNYHEIRTLHYTEIAATLTLLENSPKEGGVTNCNASCTGLCVSCTGSCTGSCSSCTSCSGCSSCTSCSGCSSCTSCQGCSGCSGCGGCDGSCYYSCTGTCKASCIGACGGGCESTCQTNCGTTCGGCGNSCLNTCYSYCRQSV